MNSKRLNPAALCGQTSKLCQISLVVLLAACGDGSSGSGPANDPTGAGNSAASVSAAQLANDDTNSLTVAQAVGAGELKPPTGSTTGSTTGTADAGSTGGAATTGSGNGSTSGANGGATAGSDGGSGAGTSGATTGSGNGSTAGTTGGASTGTGNGGTTGSTAAGATTGAGSGSTAGNTTGSGSATTAGSSDGSGADSTAGSTTGTTTTDSGDSGDGGGNEPDQGAANPDTGTNGSTTSGTSTPPEAVQKNFVASNTNGFTGEVLDNGHVKIQWQRDPTARGYNVYREAKYVTTVFATEWIDTDTYDQSHYYEIQAFDFAENYNYIATGLTVKVTGTGRVNPDAPVAKTNLTDGFTLVFSDEFNGTELDKTKWNTQYLWGPDLVINSEEQYYVDINNKPDFGYNPFRFDGENIIITTQETPDNLLDKANGQKYLSGVFTSYDAFKFTYGYVEARAKMPYGRGFWPAFWLLNAYYVDRKPEIDIMEHIANDQDVVYHTYHYYDADDNLRSTHSEPAIGVDFSGDFHKFAVDWQPGRIIFYVDDVETHRISDPQVSAQDMYIIFNTAVGGWWPGSPDATTQFPAEYKIDYVRAYQKTTPYNDIPIFQDDTGSVDKAEDVPGSSPNHFPPCDLWPNGCPGKPQ